MSERETALKLASHILDRSSGDPDDDLAVLSRQLLGTRERLDSAERALWPFARGWGGAARAHFDFYRFNPSPEITHERE